MKIRRLNAITQVVSLLKHQVHQNMSLQEPAGSGEASQALEGPTTAHPSGAVDHSVKESSSRKRDQQPVGSKRSMNSGSNSNALAVTNLGSGSGDAQGTPVVSGQPANARNEDDLLVFAEATLKQLQRRTDELRLERTLQKNKFRLKHGLFYLKCYGLLYDVFMFNQQLRDFLPRLLRLPPVACDL